MMAKTLSSNAFTSIKQLLLCMSCQVSHYTHVKQWSKTFYYAVVIENFDYMNGVNKTSLFIKNIHVIYIFFISSCATLNKTFVTT